MSIVMRMKKKKTFNSKGLSKRLTGIVFQYTISDSRWCKKGKR